MVAPGEDPRDGMWHGGEQCQGNEGPRRQGGDEREFGQRRLAPRVRIRERLPEEAAVDAAIRNAAYPPDLHVTLQEVLSWEQGDQPEDSAIRLLALVGERAVGTGRAVHRPRMHPPGRFVIDIAVRPEYQKRGIARRLYHQLLQRARAAGAREAACRVRQMELAGLESWLAAEGFHQAFRMREWELRLADIDVQAYALFGRRVEEQDIALVALSDWLDSRREHRLWLLYNRVRRDVPFGAAIDELPFEHFEQMLRGPQWLLGCLTIAVHDGQPIGFAILTHDAPGRARSWLVGVDTTWRNHGVATAVKARSARLARDRGYISIRATNHLDNPPMLAVNERLGYRPLPDVITLVKVL